MSDTTPPRKLPPREPVNLAVSRAEIELGDARPVLQKLLSLLETPERAVSYRARVCLVIEGYDGDERQPYEIDAVRSFFGGVDARFPYWFYFLSRGDDSLALIASLLTGTEEVSPGVVRIDRDDMARYFERQYAGLDNLFGMLELPTDDIERIAQEIEAYYFGRALDKPEGDPTLH